MKKSEKLNAERSFAAELARQDVTNNKKGIRLGSTASHAKGADYKVRDYLMVKGVGSTDDVRCRPGSKHDWELTIRRTLHVVGETKVGTGALRYAKTAEELSFDPDYIYPDVDYIAYCVDSRKLKAHPERMNQLFRVFTRDEFLQVLVDCGRKGLESSLRIHQSTSGTWQLEIVAWSNSQTAARLGKYESWIKAHDIPTLEEFRTELRG